MFENMLFSAVAQQILFSGITIFQTEIKSYK